MFHQHLRNQITKVLEIEVLSICVKATATSKKKCSGLGVSPLASFFFIIILNVT